MEKLLFLGNNCHVDEMIKYAKERGVYTIVTDNLPLEKSPVKQMADEAWDISVTDIDELAVKCKEEKITAVLCGASELCANANRKLCKKLGLHFFSEDRTWEIVNDKNEFKKVCEKCGLEVPRGYELDINFSPEDLAAVDYPVVVKPADGYGSIGLHICHNESELKDGYKDAYEKSETKKVVVEEYIEGELAGFVLALKDGKSVIAICGDDTRDRDDSAKRVFGFEPSKHLGRYEQMSDKINRLLEELGCKEGVCGLQFLTNGNRFALLEMNYRLPGGKNTGEELLCNTMLDTVLNKKIDMPFEQKSFEPKCGYAFWLKPGTIKEITGIDELMEKIPSIKLQILRKAGDVIEADGGMRCILAFMTFVCKEEEYDAAVGEINRTLIVRSEAGEIMNCPYRYDPNGYAVRVD